MRFASRGMRQRGDSDKWGVTLSHRDPATGKQVRSFHTVEAKTLKQAKLIQRPMYLERALMFRDADLVKASTATITSLP